MLGYVASSMAQTTSEHLTFKGIPIDGPLNAFVAKRKAAGFKHLGTEDGFAYLEGDFAGLQRMYYMRCDARELQYSKLCRSGIS